MLFFNQKGAVNLKMKFTAETQRTQRFEWDFQTLRSLRLCGADFYSAIKNSGGI
jgi:hypothetical protein